MCCMCFLWTRKIATKKTGGGEESALKNCVLVAAKSQIRNYTTDYDLVQHFGLRPKQSIYIFSNNLFLDHRLKSPVCSIY